MDRFNTQFNKEVINDVIDFKKQIEEEKASDNPDLQKLQELYMKQLWRGMQINNGYKRSFQTPY